MIIDTEAINRRVAAEIMGWCECSLSNHNIPMPDYMNDRRYSAAVVEQMRDKPVPVIDSFNKKIEAYMVGIERQIGQCKPVDWLLFITPDVICEAALAAIEKYRDATTP